MRKADSPQMLVEVRKARGRFAAMAATYFLGVFNDNFFKQAAMLTAAAVPGSALQGDLMVVFTLPFIILAAPAGWLADRFSKRDVVVGSKVLELVAMLLGAWGVITGNWLLIFAMLGVMASQSAIFSPSLNGSIPELYPAAYVTRANARIKVITTGAILVGIASSGFALSAHGIAGGVTMGQWLVAGVIVAVSAVGVVTSLGVSRRPAAAPNEPFPWRGMLHTLRTLEETGSDRLLAISIATNSMIWCVASLQILLVNAAGRAQFGMSEAATSLLIVAELVGVAAGGLLAARFVRGRRWYGILTPATAALGGLMVLVAFVPMVRGGARFAVFFALLAGMGLAGGSGIVPLESFIQVRPAPDRKGAVLSAANSAAFFGMLLSGPLFNFLNATLRLRPTTGFAVGGTAVLAVSVWMYLVWNASESRRRMAAAFVDRVAGPVLDVALRVFVKSLLRLRYRIRVTGLDAVAARGTTASSSCRTTRASSTPSSCWRSCTRTSARRILGRQGPDRPLLHPLAGPAPRREADPDRRTVRPARARRSSAAIGAERRGAARAGDYLLLYPAGHVYRSCLEDLRRQQRGVDRYSSGCRTCAWCWCARAGSGAAGSAGRAGRAPDVARLLRRGVGACCAAASSSRRGGEVTDRVRRAG